VSDQASDLKLDDLVKLFKRSFPDIRCLRCGYQSFNVLPATRQTFRTDDLASAPQSLPVITLACARCGHIEQHLSDRLGDSPIQIETEKTAG
jgi:ribosomal protein L37E